MEKYNNSPPPLPPPLPPQLSQPLKTNMKYLFVIDMQNDFIEHHDQSSNSTNAFKPKLPAANSDKDFLNGVANFISTKGCWDRIYVSQDYHPERKENIGSDIHCSFDAFPEHCMQGDRGVEIHPIIKDTLDTIPCKVDVYKGFHKDYESYAAFPDPKFVGSQNFNKKLPFRAQKLAKKSGTQKCKDDQTYTGSYIDSTLNIDKPNQTFQLKFEGIKYYYNKQNLSKHQNTVIDVIGLCTDFCAANTAINLKQSCPECTVNFYLKHTRPIGYKISIKSRANLLKSKIEISPEETETANMNNRIAVYCCIMAAYGVNVFYGSTTDKVIFEKIPDNNKLTIRNMLKFINSTECDRGDYVIDDIDKKNFKRVEDIIAGKKPIDVSFNDILFDEFKTNKRSQIVLSPIVLLMLI